MGWMGEGMDTWCGREDLEGLHGLMRDGMMRVF